MSNEKKVLLEFFDLVKDGKLNEFKEQSLVFPPVDIAEGLEELDSEDMLRTFRLLPKSISADVFAYMTTTQQQAIVERASGADLRHLVDDMFLDDTVDFLEEMPAGVVTKVLQNTDAETRSLINQFLRYPENSAGSLMTIEYVSLKDYFTVRKAIDHIRRTGPDKETIYTCYIVDEQRRLIGEVSLQKLILAQEDVLIRDMMEKNPTFVRTQDDQEQVAKEFRHYDLLSMPVCDTENRLVGIITVDDIVDVIQEENTEDFEKMAAIIPSGDEYLDTSVIRLTRSRLPWLMLLMISATFTGAIITHFEEVLSAMVILTSFIPMLMDTAGNSGSQTSTTVIRGMALGEIEMRHLPRVLAKEMGVSLMCGGALAVVNFLRITLISGQPANVAITVSLAMLLTVVLAKLVGCLLPMFAKRVKLDPAIMAAPMITTIVDACALLIFFALSTLILGL